MPQIKLISTDIDKTISSAEDAYSDLNHFWKKPDREKLPILCFNTGRILDDAISLIKSGKLPEPSYLICGVGTLIYNYEKKQIVKEFSTVLEEDWDKEQVQEVIQKLPLNLVLQPDHFQNQYKLSYYLEDATLDELNLIGNELKNHKLNINLIYSSNKHLDFLPKYANKGNALSWLMKKLEITPQETIVAGDSGNDNAMFEIEGINGIIVGNAQEELYKLTKHNWKVYHAEKHYALGIVEGLEHYGVLRQQTIFNTLKDNGREIRKDIIEHLDQQTRENITKEEFEFIKQGYTKAIEVIHKNITPIGFTACSIKDNDSTGTDVNYNRIWARDGCITVIGTLPLSHVKTIKQCQKATLNSLLKFTTSNGQVPSNVDAESETPDYSGVGGICSIDSGIWIIIAFYHYIKKTGEIEFLRQNNQTLKSIMHWLSAHDGNRDALLEIPEAGDWTDLYGRSYNVLYDQVIWYYANLLFGRMQEILGDSQEAGTYIRWSQVIKKEIIINFWPSTKIDALDSIVFSERQYSIGDVKYLIAQITPFDYSWRCDTYGNILAYLYDIVDWEKAISTFRFMWGTGVNEPYPISNVYPEVNPGDQDWRPYYTVNLLNLPHHYHNGGIWPFIGGLWIDYINKLGLNDLALKELHKLAQLNKLGVQNDWEFNEWAHGTTGRPMGKAYQAWSAATYINACHTMKVINNK